MDIYTERIKPLFVRSGKSDAELEREIGIPAKKISQWNINYTKSYTKYIQQIAAYFHVSTDYLLGNTNTPAAAVEAEGVKKDPIPKDGAEDSETAELREIWSSADENERRDLLEIARMLKSRRKQNG